MGDWSGGACSCVSDVGERGWSSQVVEVLCVGVVVAEHVEVHLHGNLHRQRAGGLEVREDVELKAWQEARGQGEGRAKCAA